MPTLPQLNVDVWSPFNNIRLVSGTSPIKKGQESFDPYPFPS